MLRNILSLAFILSLLAISVMLEVNAPTLPDPKIVCEQRGGVYKPVLPGKLLKTCDMTANLK